MVILQHMRLKTRITEEVNSDEMASKPFIPLFYTVKVQIKILGFWATVWSETCGFSDGDTRPYIKNCAAEVAEALTASI